MICVILAAGKNTRLDKGIPKSLLEVDNMTLLERQISLFKAVGVTRFAVVAGYRAEMIEEVLPVISTRQLVPIEAIRNDQYELENGFSLYSAANWLISQSQEEFFFTMADHYFEQPFLQKVVDNMVLRDQLILKLVVDKPSSINKHIDLEDVTKVYSDGIHIDQIGKEIARYNYYDTGLFYVKREIFDYLRQSIDENKSSISNLVSALCKERRAGILEVSGHFWNDIDTLEDLQNTLGILVAKRK